MMMYQPDIGSMFNQWYQDSKIKKNSLLKKTPKELNIIISPFLPALKIKTHFISLILQALRNYGVKWSKLPSDLQQHLLDSIRLNILPGPQNFKPGFNAQNIANTLLALNKIGVRWDRLDASLQQQLLDSINLNILPSPQNNNSDFNTQNIANTLLALSQMGLAWDKIDTNLKQKLLNSIRLNILPVPQNFQTGFNAQCIANTLLAFNKMGLRWDRLDVSLQKQLLDSISLNILPSPQNNHNGFNAQNIANTLLALYQMGLTWDRIDANLQHQMLNSIRLNIMPGLHNNESWFNAQDIANTLLSLNKMGLAWDTIDASLQKQLLDSIRLNLLPGPFNNQTWFNSQNIVNTLLALSRFCFLKNDKVCNKIIDSLIFSWNKKSSPNKVTPIECAQVYQALCYHNLSTNKSLSINDSFIELGLSYWRQGFKTSPFQKSVEAKVRELISFKPVKVESEYQVDCYFLGIAIPMLKLVVECRSPNNFDKHGGLNLEKKSQQLYLEKKGYEIINVAYMEWLSNQNKIYYVLEGVIDRKLEENKIVKRPNWRV